MPEPNGLILQVYPLDATPASSGSPPASVRGSSSAEPSFFDSFLNQAGTIAPFARRTHPRLLPDQPILNQLASSWDDQRFQFFDADPHWDASFQFFHGRIGDWQFPAYSQSTYHCTQGSFSA
jgi:hypothetical protein